MINFLSCYSIVLSEKNSNTTLVCEQCYDSLAILPRPSRKEDLVHTSCLHIHLILPVKTGISMLVTKLQVGFTSIIIPPHLQETMAYIII